MPYHVRDDRSFFLSDLQNNFLEYQKKNLDFCLSIARRVLMTPIGFK